MTYNGNPSRNPDVDSRDIAVFTTWTPEETRALGAALAKVLYPGDFVALEGELAAGKTCLVQGMALGLGHTGTVTSPTFTLLHLYEEGRLPLYHFDVYRLTAPEELESLGYEDYFYGDGICVVEWSGLVAAYLPERRLSVSMERVDRSGSGEEAGDGEEGRRIRLTPIGGDGAWRAALLGNLCMASVNQIGDLDRGANEEI